MTAGPSEKPRKRRVPLHRLEAFSDAVFAFAVTLLVVSLSVPTTSRQLFHDMHGFVAFGICFTLLILIWVEHNRFFSLYPLNDAVTVTLNMALLFVVLLYVYPLKFLFTFLVGQFMDGPANASVESDDDVKVLMVIYGLGVVGLNAVLYCMRINVKRHTEVLRLSARDLVELDIDKLRNLLSGSVAALSILIAASTNDKGLFSGCIYFLLLPAQLLLSRHLKKTLKKLGPDNAKVPDAIPP